MEKQEMVTTIAELEAQNHHIMEQKVKHVLYSKQKLLAEQKRWERDKIAAVESIQDTLKHELESQMSQTTESVARENKHYQMEIKYQNAQVEKILHAHDTLKAQYRQLRQDRQLQEQMIQKLSQKVAFFMQVVPKLQRQEMTVSNDSSHHGKTFRRIKDCTSLQQQTDQNFLPVVNHRTSESADSASCKAVLGRRSEQSMQSIMNATNDALESHIQKCLMQNWKADVDGKLKEYAGYRMEQTTSNGKWKSRSMQPSGILEEVKDSLLHKKTVSRPPIHAMNNYNARVKGKNELHRQVATRSTR
ncbi:unnamed protein product [Albugo candida]|uniref:Uncharacterized protein n=1 Tax=Albugo candida TaxID=65357 RepID=A0A024FVL6_9STRA|nr:unnamed protein product [Albugo candida]|eukprot:CCI10947.1 unnamed protein product [Albugo candida]